MTTLEYNVSHLDIKKAVGPASNPDIFQPVLTVLVKDDNT